MSKNQIFSTIIAVLALSFLFLLPKIGEDVPNDKIIVCQMPFTGKMKVWTTPGFRFQWFGKITEYDKRKQLWFSDVDGEGGEKYDDLAIDITFNDGSKCKVSGSLAITTPFAQEDMLKIQSEYTGMSRLMSELVRQSIKKCISASGPLMSAFESYAAKKNDLIFYISDQLNNGIYKTRMVEKKIYDELTEREKVVRVAEIIMDSTAPGGYARQEESSFTAYNLGSGNLTVSDILYPDEVINQIRSQQEATMSVQTSIAESLKARQLAIKAEEEGKAHATKMRWEQEAKKIVEVTKAQQSFEVAALEAKRAKEVAEKTIQEGRAEAEVARLKVVAGLSPRERAEFDMNTRIGIAKEIANAKVDIVPKIMYVGSGSNGGNNTMDAIGLKMMYDLVDRVSK